jgi:hypothetical protein
MKKIFILFAFTLLFVSGFAQDRSLSATLGREDIFFKYPGVAKDSCGVTQDTLEYKWFINKAYDLLYDVQVKLTEIRGRGLCTVSLQGRKFESDSWSNITSVIYYGGGTDTTITFTQHTIASAVAWNHLRAYIVKVPINTVGAVKVSFVQGAVKHN